MSQIFIIALTLSLIHAKILIIPDTKLSSCEDWSTIKGFHIDLIDTSNLKIIRTNESQSFYQGSIKFLKDLTKVPGRILYEKLSQGEWSMLGFDGKYGDFCHSYHDRTQPLYYTMDHFPKCPIEAGTEWTFNMVPFTLMALNVDPMPPQYIGRWRLITIYELIIDGIRYFECRKVHFEIVDTEKSRNSNGVIGVKGQRSG
ncbi:uncharacterized protein [Chironomus tepperi]|uniref:uncharacterized protein n=1 Tax=Chironomus tepperi TaxID=113505 RepID=UPI00391F3080